MRNEKSGSATPPPRFSLAVYFRDLVSVRPFSGNEKDQPMLIGYARVSTPEQKLDMQIDALEAAGCERVFTDVASGAKAARPGLDEVLSHLRKGDTLVVWKLDRLGRSQRHLLETVEGFKERGIHFRTITEGIETDNLAGDLVFRIFTSLAEFERNLVRERTRTGLAAAKRRGRVGGRKPLSPIKLAKARALITSSDLTMAEIAADVGVSIAALYRYFPGGRNAVEIRANEIRRQP